MSEIIRKNLAILTLMAALVGALVSMPLRDRVHHKSLLTQQELRRELELGTKMPLVAFSRELTKRFAQSGTVPNLSLRITASDKPELFIADKYAIAALNCDTSEPEFALITQTYGGVWFRGTASAAPQIIPVSPDKFAGTISFDGSVYRCQGSQLTLAASGMRVDVPLEEVGVGSIPVRASQGWLSYPAAAADLFVSFLLMIFIPTLTLSIVKAIVDSAQSEGGTASLFRYSFKFFGATTLLAALLGLLAGYVCYRIQAGSDLNEIVAVCIGSKPVPTEYEPHPILNQLTNIIPTNPLGALSNPDGNKGLQVAFTAIMIGILLAVISPAQRLRASQFLKNALALIVKDTDLKWQALSDWADLLTPLGVFFIVITFCGSVSRDFIWQMGYVILCILCALLVHAGLLVTWIMIRRDWSDWLQKGLLPGIPGLVTALATSSSYAALPGITGVDLLAKNSSRRGIFDFCTTINKNGTTIYIATMAAYVLFDRVHGAMHPLVFIVLLLSGLASVATAGLPFAAVFGLRMVLLASGSAGGLAWVILPLDPLVDRFVTVVNVFANLAACSGPKPKVVGMRQFISDGNRLPSHGAELLQTQRADLAE